MQPLYDNEGITLLAADINRDGFDDLVVGSPYSPYSQSAGPNRSAGPTGTGPTGAGPQSGKVCFILSSKTFDFSTWKCIWGPGVSSNWCFLLHTIIYDYITNYTLPST